MLQFYGITWNDASGDSERLEIAIRDGIPPDQFARQFGEKYDLQPRIASW
jgi:hypothetical protein